ncbi:MAG: GntR family transcriptional regulator [Chlamydiota bacterium]
MEHTTLAHQCYELIRAQIISGEILPGKKLKILTLSKALNTGPTPVREALSRLINTGLVEATENQGFRVSSLSRSGIKDLYLTFFQIESLALKESIAKGDDAWAAQVVAAQYQLSLTEDGTVLQLEQYPKWFERNQQFHGALINGCGSPCLLEIRNRLYVQFDRYIRLALQKNPEPFVLDHSIHKELGEATIRREEKRALALLKSDILDGMDAVLKTLDEHLT